MTLIKKRNCAQFLELRQLILLLNVKIQKIKNQIKETQYWEQILNYRKQAKIAYINYRSIVVRNKR